MTGIEDHAKYASVRTGDILLFAGWWFPSLLVRVGTYSEWTHASIAVWLKTDQGRRLYMFEAARINDEHCALSNGLGEGCRLIDIDQVSHAYSRMSVRPVSGSRDKPFYDKLLRFMREFKGKEFPTSFVRVALVNAGLAKRRTEDDGKILCSELCSVWLQRSEAFQPLEAASYPHYLAAPCDFAADVKYPTSTFAGPLCLLKDDGMDGAVRTSVAAIWVCSLFLYVLLGIEDEKRYRSGYVRARWKRRQQGSGR